MRTEKQQSQTIIVIFFFAVLLAMGVGYKLNSDQTNVDNHIEKFEFR